MVDKHYFLSTSRQDVYNLSTPLVENKRAHIDLWKIARFSWLLILNNRLMCFHQQKQTEDLFAQLQGVVHKIDRFIHFFFPKYPFFNRCLTIPVFSMLRVFCKFT